MPASRLSEEQKEQIVERFRRGVATVDLADVFGCSPNTVSRLVRSAMDEAEYEELKRQRQRRAVSPSSSAEADSAPGPVAPEPVPQAPVAAPQLPLPTLDIWVAAAPPAVDVPVGDGVVGPEDVVDPPVEPLVSGAPEPDELPGPPALGADSAQDPVQLTVTDRLPEAGSDAAARLAPSADVELVRVGRGSIREESEAEPASLAIDDADDFGDDDEDEDLGEEDPDSPEVASVWQAALVPITPIGVDDQPRLASAQAWTAASLPGSAYMLVEKTVELQPQLLRDLPELGQLPEDEQDRQALVLFVNPRQAKRVCARHQRVIRIPDTQVFQLTATKLAAQGITRVVVDGSLVALPGC